jgi:hypothetical protein
MIVTAVPGVPEAGEKEVIVGAGAAGGGGTVNVPELTAVPAPVVTEIRPVTAFCGTDAVICVDESTLKKALAPPNVTPVAPEKFVPWIVTDVPG